jgi:hypothetical protein
MIPVSEDMRIDVIPRRTMKNRITIINEEITHGIPVFTFSFLIIGKNTNESMKERTTGIKTLAMVLHRKPASTTARNNKR